MVVRSAVLDVVREFNRMRADVSAEVLGADGSDIKVVFSGPYCAACSGEFPDFRELLEAKLLQPVVVKSVEKTGAQEYNIVYALSSESPADKIIKVLRQYEEGTPMRGQGFED